MILWYNSRRWGATFSPLSLQMIDIWDVAGVLVKAESTVKCHPEVFKLLTISAVWLLMRMG